jgi:PAS domain S-box-containing protein
MRQPTYEELEEENSRLKGVISKLTVELSDELIENIEAITLIKKKHTNYKSIFERHVNLIGSYRLMESRYRLIAEDVAEMVLFVDRNSVCIYANKSAAGFLNKTVPEMIGKHIFEIMGTEMADQFLTTVFNPIMVSATSLNKTGRFILKDRTYYIEFNAHPIFNVDNVITGVIVLASDRTEMKQIQSFTSIEKEFNALNTLSGEVKEIIKDVFYKLCSIDGIDIAGLYLWNDLTQTFEIVLLSDIPLAAHLFNGSFGKDTKEYEIASRGIPQYDCFNELSSNIKNILLGLGVKQLVVIPILIENKTIGTLNMASRSAIMLTQSQRTFIESMAWRISTVINLRNTRDELKTNVEKVNETIKDLRIKQQMLIQKSKMESLGEMSAGISHEINQPLLIISLSIENIMSRMSARKTNLSKDYLATKFHSIILNVKRIQNNIENLRVFSRDQTGILFEKVNIKDVINASIMLVEKTLQSSEIVLKCNFDSEDIFILGNIISLEQILINLFSNSIYALNEKKIWQDFEDNEKQIKIVVSPGPETVRLDFTDNGIGIPEEIIDHIMTPFVTSKSANTGTGLGLSITYGLVKEMNGTIHITSKENEYTNVRLAFPKV